MPLSDHDKERGKRATLDVLEIQKQMEGEHTVYNQVKGSLGRKRS
jgi:hypothetical protein